MVLVAGVVLACGQANPPSAVTPVTSSPSSSTSSSTRSNAPPALVLSCRLPVLTFPGRTASNARDGGGRGAWLDLATGSLTIDSTSPNADQLFYSRAAKRWLPVRREAVSSDGLQYAHVDHGAGAANNLHVIDAASGREAVFSLPSAGLQALWDVLDFSPPLVTIVSSYRAVSQLDLRSGKVTPIGAPAPVWKVDGGVVWAGSVNPADPNPVPGFTVQPDEVDRYALGGSKEVWLYRPSTSLSVMALDPHGLPIVLSYVDASGAQAELLLLTAPNATKRLTLTTAADIVGTGPLEYAVDTHGVWFGFRDGIYLLPDGGTLLKVSDVVATPAGGCE